VLCLDGEGIINETTVEEDNLRVTCCNDRGFFMVQIVQGCVSASTRHPNHCPIALAPITAAKGEYVGPHDDVEASMDSFHRELGKELVHMEIEPVLDGINPMVVVDVHIHCNDICGVDDSVIHEWGRVFRSHKSCQLSAILQVGWGEMQNLLQVVVNPLADMFRCIFQGFL
jgi:hypothetical protein